MWLLLLLIKFLTTSFNYRAPRDEDMACRETIKGENNGSCRAGFLDNKVSSKWFWQGVIEVAYKIAILCQPLFILLKATFWKMQGLLCLYSNGLSQVDIWGVWR